MNNNIVNEREIALFALIDIIERNGYNNIVLRKTLSQNNDLKPFQKAFITEIVNGTLRNLIHLDYIIDQFSKTKTPKIRPIILNILRISVYQIKFMDKVPHSAVCNEAVNLAKKNGFIGLSGFVNGVLRNITRNIDNIPYPNYEKEPEKYIEIMYSMPMWIVKYFKSFLGLEETAAICKSFLNTPEITACVNTLKTTANELIKTLENEDIIALQSNTRNAIKLKNTSDLTKLESFKKGLFHIMDESSMKAAETLNPKPFDKVLDICSAPGGKSFYMAYMMENKGKIIANDIHEHKIQLIHESAERLGINIIETKFSDASIYNSEFEEMDCVLLDAPCSGLGLMRKKPDIKHTKTFDDIIELAALQKKMLENASKYVKNGGKLLYSTCTISKRENEDNIAWFLENFDFELTESFYQFPHTHNTDGFFVALFTRKG